MSAKNIILVIPSRLLRGLLERALGKVENLVVVEAISDPEFLPDTVWETDIDWVVISSEGCLGLLKWFDEFANSHPSICIIALTAKGSSVNINWLNNSNEEIRDISLEELIILLKAGRKYQLA